ncbi:F-box domain-containing protein [Pleurotus pulmonarius]
MNTKESLELADFYDSQIDTHHDIDELRILRERRNADCSQTRRLPPEILTKIFSILGTFHYEDRYTHLKWVAVTHVCRTWRDNALNEPTLWTDFTDIHPKWVREIFTRSKAAPLRLRYGYDDCSHNTLNFVVDALVKSPERIRELHAIDYDGSFIGQLTRPTPFLESFAIELGAGVSFPPNFLGGVAPRLRSVRCTGPLPLEAGWFTNVRNLEYNGSLDSRAYLLTTLTSLTLERGATYGMSIDTLLSALESSPSLECLFIVAASDMDTVSRPRRSTPLHLHHLRDITFDLGSKSRMAKIFRHLRVDNIEKLCTSWSYNFQNITMLEHVCHFFNTCYHGDDLRYVVYDMSRGLEMYTRSVDEGGPSLFFRLYAWADPSKIVKLLPRCVPRILSTRLHPDMKALALSECDTIEEVHIPYGRVNHHFRLDGASLSYPSLQRLHFGGVVSLDAEQVSQLVTWLAPRQSKVEVVIREGGIPAKAIDALQDASILHFI